ncbi:MAG: recombinase family protein [Clostridium sp.]
MSNIIGYCRVSTIKQLDGNSLEIQKNEILNRYSTANIFEEQFSAKTSDRPILNDVLDNLNVGDTLVVSKLDRLARNTVEGINIVEDLFAKGVAVHVLNVGLLENTSMGKFFLTTLLAVAEMERNTIIERTQTGKAIAKTKAGFKDGRPKEYTQHQLDSALIMLTVNGGESSYNEVARLTQISKSTLIREQRKQKVNKID